MTEPQRFATDPNPVPFGEPVLITFSNPALAGQTVKVHARRPGTNDPLEIEIYLDEQTGVGSVSWFPPEAWTEFLLQHSTSADHAVLILDP